MTAAGTARAKWGSAKVTTHHDDGRNGADEVRGGAVDDNVTQVTMTAAATVRTE